MNRLIILTNLQAQTLEDLVDEKIREMAAGDQNPAVISYVNTLEEIYAEVRGASVSELATLRQENHDLKNSVTALKMERDMREKGIKK